MVRELFWLTYAFCRFQYPSKSVLLFIAMVVRKEVNILR
jgi:hypothetical protein